MVLGDHCKRVIQPWGRAPQLESHCSKLHYQVEPWNPTGSLHSSPQPYHSGENFLYYTPGLVNFRGYILLIQFPSRQSSASCCPCQNFWSRTSFCPYKLVTMSPSQACWQRQEIGVRGKELTLKVQKAALHQSSTRPVPQGETQGPGWYQA